MSLNMNHDGRCSPWETSEGSPPHDYISNKSFNCDLAETFWYTPSLNRNRRIQHRGSHMSCDQELMAWRNDENNDAWYPWVVGVQGPGPAMVAEAVA